MLTTAKDFRSSVSTDTCTVTARRQSDSTLDIHFVDHRLSCRSNDTLKYRHANQRSSVDSQNTIRQKYLQTRASFDSSKSDFQHYNSHWSLDSNAQPLHLNEQHSDDESAADSDESNLTIRDPSDTSRLGLTDADIPERTITGVTSPSIIHQDVPNPAYVAENLHEGPLPRIVVSPLPSSLFGQLGVPRDETDAVHIADGQSQEVHKPAGSTSCLREPQFSLPTDWSGGPLEQALMNAKSIILIWNANDGDIDTPLDAFRKAHTLLELALAREVDVAARVQLLATRKECLDLLLQLQNLEQDTDYMACGPEFETFWLEADISRSPEPSHREKMLLVDVKGDEEVPAALKMLYGPRAPMPPVKKDHLKAFEERKGRGKIRSPKSTVRYKPGTIDRNMISAPELFETTNRQGLESLNSAYRRTQSAR